VIGQPATKENKGHLLTLLDKIPPCSPASKAINSRSYLMVFRVFFERENDFSVIA
jgi:hypothetical protein